MSEINVNINNINFKIDLDKLKKQKPVFSVFKGRRFEVEGPDHTIHKLKLNDIFLSAIHDKKITPDKIDELFDTFQNVKDKGYEKNSALTKFTALFARKIGKGTRKGIQNELIEQKFKLDDMLSGKEPFNYENLKKAVENGYSNKNKIKKIVENESNVGDKTPTQSCEFAKFIMDESLMKRIGKPRLLSVAYEVLARVPSDAPNIGEVEYLKGKNLLDQNKREEARPHFEKAAEKGNLDGHFWLGHAYSTAEERINHYKIASEGGRANASYYLGMDYLDQREETRDPDTIKQLEKNGEKYLAISVAQGHHLAPFQLGKLYYDEGKFKEAVELLEKSIKDLPVRFDVTYEVLQDCYANGKGVAPDPKKADYYQKIIDRSL